MYLHDTRRDLPDHVVERDQGWVMQGVPSRASFRHPPLSGQKTYGVVSTYKQYLRQKKAYCKNIHPLNPSHHYWSTDWLVAGDFNGTAWRCSNRDNVSTINKAFADCVATAAGPSTIVGTRIDSKQLGVRLLEPQAARFRSVSEGTHAWCVLHPTQNSRPASNRSKSKVTIMRHGSTWISSIGATPNHITKNRTDEFYSKNVPRFIIKGRRRGGSVIS